MANRKTTNNVDQDSVIAQQFNVQAGAEKNIDVGAHLKPIKLSETSWTCDATTARVLPSKGKSLAIYNNADAVGTVTLGDDATVTSLAPGVTDSTGKVGIPCTPNSWTYISCNDKRSVISSVNTILVFVIEDDSYLQ